MRDWSTNLSRRGFVRQAALLPFGASLSVWAAEGKPELRNRIEGLLLGSLIGDALGGPVEFQDPASVRRLPYVTKRWRDEEVLDAAALKATAQRVELRTYRHLRPKPEPYAHWTEHAEPGTITDDSRHKLVLLDALKEAEATGTWPFDARALAKAYVNWPNRKTIQNRAGYGALSDAWLEEWLYATRWVLGERDTSKAIPPERLWNGLPTCCGQMVLLPLAAVFAGRPVDAYRAAYHLAYFDNGWGKDLNAALVAGLATALVTSPTERGWAAVLRTLRETDPYRYEKVPWTHRSVDRWLDVAERLAREAEKRPARLFAGLEREFHHTIKWEAQVPFVVTFAVLALADYDPLAALQLSIEWGHDTDSYAQLVGAFTGALHGAGVFDAGLRETVKERLRLDYGADVDAYVALLERLEQRNREESLIRLGR